MEIQQTLMVWEPGLIFFCGEVQAYEQTPYRGYLFAMETNLTLDWIVFQQEHSLVINCLMGK